MTKAGRLKPFQESLIGDTGMARLSIPSELA
jgi:hypothetical protein